MNHIDEEIKILWEETNEFNKYFPSYEAFHEWMNKKNALYSNLGPEHGDFAGDVNKDLTPYEVLMKEGLGVLLEYVYDIYRRTR